MHKPLNHSMTQRTRRRRVEEKRLTLAQWADQERVSVVALLGYLLHVEARKVTTEDNFRDCYNHLWDRSRPTIVEMERTIRRKEPKVISFNCAIIFFHNFSK